MAVLSPDTATMVAHALIVHNTRSTRSEVVKIVCSSRKCERECTICLGKAYLIVRAYGARRG